MAACSLAFAAWALALPDTPLRDADGYDTAWAAAIITGALTTITIFAWAFVETAPDFKYGGSNDGRELHLRVGDPEEEEAPKGAS
jgi:hypothetical protein